jgi:hypothetical protein
MIIFRSLQEACRVFAAGRASTATDDEARPAITLA